MSERRVVEATMDFHASMYTREYYCGTFSDSERYCYIKGYCPRKGEVMVVESCSKPPIIPLDMFMFFKVVEEGDE